MKNSELEKLLKEKKVSVIDVRIEEKYEAGHIKDAQNIPLEDLKSQLDKLDKEETHYVICTQGVRSQKAVDLLIEEGYKAINIDGGMEEWTGELEK